MVITDDETVWKRAVMFHDVIGGLRNGFPAGEIIWGINFRMPELLAAVALTQLRRLDGLLGMMRARKHSLKAGLEAISQGKSISFREIADPGGDTGIALVFFAQDPPRANRIAEALRAENIGASALYHPERVDYHIYVHWTPIMAQRTWTPGGGPWRWARREIHYSPDMCPRTLDLLGRAVHLDVSPLLTDEDIEETLDGLSRVLGAIT
jgi:dTDP-4-amino-4,6-dideoxygalactose transaminase